MKTKQIKPIKIKQPVLSIKTFSYDKYTGVLQCIAILDENTKATYFCYPKTLIYDYYDDKPKSLLETSKMIIKKGKPTII